jgi:hypothetical protein
MRRGDYSDDHGAVIDGAVLLTEQSATVFVRGSHDLVCEKTICRGLV